MVSATPLDQTFPNHAAEIAHRREHDAAFNEVCSDYEDLMRRIPASALAHRDSLETLIALQVEIEACLRTPPPEGDEK